MARKTNENQRNEKKLRQRLNIIQTLVTGLPFLVVLYLYFHYQDRLDFDGWSSLVFALILLTVLAGLFMLREFFHRFIEFSKNLEKAALGQEEFLDSIRRSDELSEMASTFSGVVANIEKTRNEISEKISHISMMKELLGLAEKGADMDELLERLLEKSMILAGSEIASVFSVSWDGGLRLIRFQTPGEPPPENFPFEEKSRVMRHVLTEGAPLRVTDIETDPRLKKTNDPKYGSPSFICLPVRAGGDIVGLLNLARKSNRAPFTKDDESLLTILLAELEFALRNAFLNSQCQALRQQLQQANESVEQERLQHREKSVLARKLSGRLAQARKTQALGALCGGLASDFNNLLMAIQGNISLLLLESREGTARYQRLKSMERQVESGSLITAQLLGLTRNGKSDLPNPDLNAMVSEKAEAYARARKDLSVSLDLGRNLPPVTGDPAEAEKMIWDIFINAGNSLPKGGSLVLSTRLSESGDCLVLKASGAAGESGGKRDILCAWLPLTDSETPTA